MEKRIVNLDECQSTSEELKQGSYNFSGQIIKTNFQTAGKGQRKKKWICSKGNGLLFSIQYLFNLEEAKRTNFLLQNMAFFSLIAGVQLRKILAKWSQPFKLKQNKFLIKWPNDILYTEKKIAGILCETQTLASLNSLQLIIGIGINIFSSPSKQQLSETGNNKLAASSIQEQINDLKYSKKIKPSTSDVELLLNNIVYSLDKYFLNNDSLNNPVEVQKWKEQTIKELNLFSYLKNKNILIDGKIALCKDVSRENAALLIEIEGQQEELFSSNFTLL